MHYFPVSVKEGERINPKYRHMSRDNVTGPHIHALLFQL